MQEQAIKETWDIEIRPRQSLFDIDFKAIWRYKDLLTLFVRRDFVAVYKQTILGPLWFFIQPLLTTITFTVIFGNVAKIPTDGIPPLLFYLSGITMWNYFAACLTGTSNTFVANQALFGKVYFPRVIVPLSVVISNLIKFGVQVLLFLAIWAYYYFMTDTIQVQWTIVLLPVLVLLMAGLGLGFGMIISAMTTKYRDLQFLVTFGVQLMMYASAVVYPFSVVQGTRFEWLIALNPTTPIIETFKHGFTGMGYFSPMLLLYSFGVMVVLLFIGTVIFNKVEKNFMDTV
jgi:homopolymeric O-antigen transport system permease protein